MLEILERHHKDVMHQIRKFIITSKEAQGYRGNIGRILAKQLAPVKLSRGVEIYV